MYSLNVLGTEFDIDKRYKFLKAIGQGAYGVVICAIDVVTGEKVAIKKIPRVFADVIETKKALREIKLLTSFDHDNVRLQRHRHDSIWTHICFV